jgi:MFS family permease
LAIVHGLSSAGDAFFTVSLADSLFFNVSVEAARPRILLYLALTMAPFAMLAPLIGPFIDRFRGGRRIVLLVTMFGRAALTLALVQDLRSLWIFPEAFGVLVLGKAYSVARSATVPRLVADDRQLVAANAFLARVGLVASSVAGGGAALALQASGSTLLLYVATALLVTAGIVVVTGASAPPARRGQTRLEYHELHAVRLTRAVFAMGLLRASVGMLTFLFAFAMKRAGAPVWQFGLMLVAGGVGAVTATTISAMLRRRFREERILVLSLAAPALVTMVGVTLQFSIVTAVIVSAALGLAASTAKHVFDAFVQRTAPDADMARAFAGFETRFQLFWIAGATLAVLAQADPRLGLLAMCLTLGGGAIAVDRSLRASARFETPPNLVATVSQLVLEDAQMRDAPTAVLNAADVLVRGGSTEAAVIVAAAALDARRDLGPTPHSEAMTALESASAQLSALRDAVVRDRRVAVRDVEHAIAAARAALDADEPQAGPGVR